MKRRRSTFHAAAIIGAIVVIWQAGMNASSEGVESVVERLYWADVNMNKIPESPELLALGRTTYGQRCVGCHGQSGLGNGPAAAYLLTKPRDFSEGQFKLRTTMDFPTDEDLYRTITVGFPAYSMPHFTYLPEELRWGLVYYVKQLGRQGFQRQMAKRLAQDELDVDLDSLTPGQEAELKERIAEIREESADIADFLFEPDRMVELPEPMPATAANLQRGKEVYSELECNKCHGDAGHGDGPSAQELTDDKGRQIWPRDFAMNGWYFKGGERPGDIFRVLLTGMPGTPMPSYDMGVDSYNDLWNLSHYIRTLVGSD